MDKKNCLKLEETFKIITFILISYYYLIKSVPKKIFIKILYLKIIKFKNKILKWSKQTKLNIFTGNNKEWTNFAESIALIQFFKVHTLTKFKILQYLVKCN